MNYNTLRNKPTINYKELIGDNTVTEVGGITEEQFNTLLNTDLASYYTKEQIDELFSRSYVYREKSGSVVTFDCPSTPQNIPEVTAEIVAVQSGTGDPSPTNIRPITGWSAVDVTRCGKNWCPISSGEIKSGNLVTFTNALPSGTYSISLDVTRTGESSSEASIIIYDKEDNAYTTRSLIPNTGNRIKFENLNFNNGISRIYFYSIAGSWGQSQNYTLNITDFQLELGETANTYEAYSGTTYTTTLKDGQGNPLTCYGGELSNENGVQTLELTHGYIASYNGEALPSTWISDRDVYAEGTTPTTGAEVVYTLATPTTIPQDNLAIATQDGINNIWADSGDITVKALDRIIQG